MENSKTVATIIAGETLLVSVKAVNGGKYQLEFAEQIQNPYAKARNGITSMLNKSDSRFSSKARRAWVTGEKMDIEELLGLSLNDMTVGQSKELNILNPEIGGTRLRVQIEETITGSEYQLENVETTAKKAGVDGDYIFSDGQHIFTNLSIVSGNAAHTFLKPDTDEAPTNSVEESIPSNNLTV